MENKEQEFITEEECRGCELEKTKCTCDYGISQGHNPDYKEEE